MQGCRLSDGGAGFCEIAISAPGKVILVSVLASGVRGG